MKTDRNKMSRQSRLQKVLSGMSKHFQNVPALTIAQVAYTVAELEARIQKDIDTSDTTASSRAVWQADVQKERLSHRDTDPLMRGIKRYVQLTWGDSQASSSVLDDFGYAPRKPMTVKPDTQVTAAAKAKATRIARHTVGPKEKLKIKGTLPATTATPAAPPTAPAATPPARPQ